MVNLYCLLIINKRRNFNQIPDNLKVEVETRLRELGYDTNGYPLVSQGVTMFYILVKMFIGGDNMVALYVALIINGRRTFAQVPTKFKEAVKADLESLGLDENGCPV